MSDWDGGRASTATVVLVTPGANGRAMSRPVICGLVVEGGADGCRGRSVASAGEQPASDRHGDVGWRPDRIGHELSRPIDGVGQCRGWQPGSKVSMMTMRPPQRGQLFHSSSA
jgi:hypothetical protein